MDPGTIMAVVAAVAAVSEALSLIPGLKSNGIFQLVYYVIKSVAKGIKTKEV